MLIDVFALVLVLVVVVGLAGLLLLAAGVQQDDGQFFAAWFTLQAVGELAKVAGCVLLAILQAISDSSSSQ